jgi:hypothetical protein
MATRPQGAGLGVTGLVGAIGKVGPPLQMGSAGYP